MSWQAFYLSSLNVFFFSKIPNLFRLKHASFSHRHVLKTIFDINQIVFILTSTGGWFALLSIWHKCWQKQHFICIYAFYDLITNKQYETIQKLRMLIAKSVFISTLVECANSWEIVKCQRAFTMLHNAFEWYKCYLELLEIQEEFEFGETGIKEENDLDFRSNYSREWVCW